MGSIISYYYYYCYYDFRLRQDSHNKVEITFYIKLIEKKKSIFTKN